LTTALPAGANTIGVVGITGTATVTGTVTLGASAASIGTVGLNAGANIVGKFGVDQTTLGTTNRVYANLDQVAGAAIAQGHGVAATALRVELPTDGTGQINLAQGSAALSGTNPLPMTPYDSAGTQINFSTPVQVYSSNAYLNIPAGLATTTVKSGAGTLFAVMINTKGTAANTITLYDSTAASGTKIATIDGTSDRDHVFDGGIGFSIGLVIVSATGTGADMTICFR
jgi:hypothetical protein